MEEWNALTGEELNILAVAYANAIAVGMDAGALGVLACVFTVVGDALGTIAATRGNSEAP